MIMVIGGGPPYEFHIAPVIGKIPELLGMDYTIFDMAAFPERGDAIDELEQNNNYKAIVALHLFGIGSDSPRMIHLDADYFYNKRNHELPNIARKHGIPLFVVGDQPSMPWYKSRTETIKEYR